jgi:hypothetical protein
LSVLEAAAVVEPQAVHLAEQVLLELSSLKNIISKIQGAIL